MLWQCHVRLFQQGPAISVLMRSDFFGMSHIFSVRKCAILLRTIFEGALQYNMCHAVYFHVPSTLVRVPRFSVCRLCGFNHALN